MAVPEAVLMARARGAYERGRLRTALPAAAAVALMAVLSALAHRQYAATAACAAVLAMVVLAAGWRGQAWGRGARAGLLAGLFPLVLPLTLCLHACVGGLCLLTPVVCVAAGLACGVVVGWRARDAAGGLRTALAVAALTGSLGCLVAGAGGVAGMAAGLAAGAAPVLWRRTQRA